MNKIKQIFIYRFFLFSAISCNFLLAGDAFSQAASVWTKTINPTINKCPGAAMDSRKGVGITTHPISNTTSKTIDISWPDGTFGQYSYMTNWGGNASDFNAQYFVQNRTNGFYLLRRYCNTNAKWSDPEVMCNANNGQIGNATYYNSTANANSTGKYPNSVAAADATQTLTGTCISGYWKYNNNTGAAPLRKCVYNDANNYIDKTYLTLTSSTNDCESLKCAPRAATTSASVNFAAVTGYSAVGTQIAGVCNASHSPFAYRLYGAVAPTVSCQADGTWSAVQNPNNCQTGCNTPNGASGFGSDVCDDANGVSVGSVSVAPGRYSIQAANLNGCGCASSYVTTVVCDGATGTTSDYRYIGWTGHYGTCANPWMTHTYFINSDGSTSGAIPTEWSWASVRTNQTNGTVSNTYIDAYGNTKNSKDAPASISW